MLVDHILPMGIIQPCHCPFTSVQQSNGSNLNGHSAFMHWDACRNASTSLWFGLATGRNNDTLVTLTCPQNGKLVGIASAAFYGGISSLNVRAHLRTST